MEITRKNYEAFFLDYFEDNLSPEQVAELLVFLEENRDLKEEFDEFENIATLTPDNSITFAGKSGLKKKEFLPVGKIDGTNYEEFFIASLEGDLNDNENKDVVTFLSKNPHSKLEYNALRSTFLKPDKTIVYKDKESIKKRGVLIALRPALLYAASIAALLLIFLGIYFLLKKNVQIKRDTIMISKIEPKRAIFEMREIIIPVNTDKVSPEPSIAVTDETIEQSVREENIVINSIPAKSISSIETSKTTLSYIEIPENRVDPFDNINAIADISSLKNIEKRKPFMARFLSSLVKKAIPSRATGKKSLIEYTVNSYNLLADRNLQVEKQYDEDGNLVAYNVIGNNIEIVKRVKSQAKE